MSPIRTFVLSFLIVFSPLAFSTPGYDEVRNSDGQVREIYSGFFEAWQKLTKAEREQYLEKSREAFRGDNALDPMPRVISGYEYDTTLKAGVEQRAKALVAFLKDHFSGARTYANNGILPKHVVERIIKRNIETGYDEYLGKRTLPSFVYGPDIIKDDDGEWRVIEDNPGYVGGVGDLLLAQDFYLRNFPDAAKNHKIRRAESFYDNLVSDMQKKAREKGGKAVMYLIAPHPDKEDKRFIQLLADRGIETISVYSQNQLDVREDGVWLKSQNGAKDQKIGFIFMMGEAWWLDPSDRLAYRRLLIMNAEYVAESVTMSSKTKDELLRLTEIFRDRLDAESQAGLEKFTREKGLDYYLEQDLKKARQARGLTDSFVKGQVSLSYTPGLDFIGDKEFYLYVEDLIRFYLNEEPILRNIPTESFANKATGSLKSAMVERVFSQIESYVIKVVDGRGGDGVFIGKKLTARAAAELKAKIMDSPSSYIVQKFVPLSSINDMIVDLRLLTTVIDGKVRVTDVPWGRGQSINGNGKVNLSGNGREVTVLIVDDPPSCSQLLKKAQ